MSEELPTSRDAERAIRLLDGSSDGLLLVDADGRIVQTNRGAAVMFGFDDVESDDRGGLIGLPIDDLVPDEYRSTHRAHRLDYASDPQRRPMGTDLRLFAQHRDGRLFPVEISLSPVMIDGELHTVSTVRDVTERQESRARIVLHEERERIAHDLHDVVIQRLFAVGMSLQSVMGLVDSPVARDRITSVTDDLDETVRAIRSAIFSIGSDSKSQSLTSYINSVVTERCRHLGFTPDVLISGPVDDLVDHVADQLVATLTEALSNVARHADATDVSIRITRSDTAVSLVVRDNGCGIASTPKPLGGLSNVMWRAAELGGTCSVSPIEPNGTELAWQVPA